MNTEAMEQVLFQECDCGMDDVFFNVAIDLVFLNFWNEIKQMLKPLSGDEFLEPILLGFGLSFFGRFYKVLYDV